MNIVTPTSPDPLDIPLFDGYEAEDAVEESLSAGRRLTLRQAGQISIGIHPLTGGRLHPLASRHRDSDSPKSDPFTCGSCYFRNTIPYHGKTYPKCLFDPNRAGDQTLDMYRHVSHSATTDVRAWWPACPNYSPGDNLLSPDASRSIPTEGDETCPT